MVDGVFDLGSFLENKKKGLEPIVQLKKEPVKSVSINHDEKDPLKLRELLKEESLSRGKR